jgi:hypothetical protein
MTPTYSTHLNLKRYDGFYLPFLCSLFYFVSVSLLLRDYAAVEWSIYRIYFDSIQSWDIVLAILYISVAAFFIPKNIENIHSLFIIIIYIFLYIPAGVCLLAMDSGEGINRYVTLTMMALSFSASTIFTKPKGHGSVQQVRLPPPALGPTLMVVSFVLLAFLYYRFGAIMSFASLDNLYEQRARGAANNLIEGYAQTYSQYVLATGLLSLGLYQKNILYIIFGIIGSVVNYSITAEKAGLMYPVFILFLFYALSKRNGLFNSIYFILPFISTILIFSIYTRNVFSFSEFISWYFGTRSILTPGLFVSYYTDFFFERGYTYFSHIRGFSEFIAIPAAYASDPRWPQIGIMVGEDFIGFARLNANANFVASDGIASIGTFGIFIAFGIFSIIVKAFDYLGRGIPKELLLPLLLSIALTLTNGSALSVLTSTGGFFWMLILKFGFPQNPATNPDLGR